MRAKSGIEGRAAVNSISGTFKGTSDATYHVSIMLDSPALTTTRFAYLRRVAAKCPTSQGNYLGEKYAWHLTLLPGPTVSGVDESIQLFFHPERHADDDRWM